MILNEHDIATIKYYVQQLEDASTYNDKDYWTVILCQIDNMPRTLKIKMLQYIANNT